MDQLEGLSVIDLEDILCQRKEEFMAAHQLLTAKKRELEVLNGQLAVLASLPVDDDGVSMQLATTNQVKEGLELEVRVREADYAACRRRLTRVENKRWKKTRETDGQLTQAVYGDSEFGSKLVTQNQIGSPYNVVVNDAYRDTYLHDNGEIRNKGSMERKAFFSSLSLMVKRPEATVKRNIERKERRRFDRLLKYYVGDHVYGELEDICRRSTNEWSNDEVPLEGLDLDSLRQLG